MSGEYYNSTGMRGTQLRDSQQQCKKQDEEILYYIAATHERWRPPGRIENYSCFFNAESIWSAFHNRWPITSIRRSLNTLMNDGWIQKTERTIKGMYGKPIHVYRYLPPEDYDDG